MNNHVFDNQCRVTMVCVDDYRDGIMCGRMYNSYFGMEISFSSTMEFLKKLDSMLDKMNFPQSFSELRKFHLPAAQSDKLLASQNRKRGAVATFSIRILFRQNASWQGSVTWIEGNQEEYFRSVLELMVLLDNALGYAKIE